MYRFADCELDVARRELRRGDAAVHLEPQAFDLLVLLVEQRHRVVPKHELLDGVWGHRFVSEANLTTRVKEARRAVGDDGTAQAVIRNVRGRGYRFVADLVVDDVPRAPVPAASSMVGRAADAAEVERRLAQHRLVTVSGPGGVGKSTLAAAVAAGRAQAGEMVAVVELATLTEPAAVLPTIARTLDVVIDDDRPDRAVRALALVHALLLLDNCEHVIDAVAALLDRVLAVPGGVLQVLATSRVRVGLGDEQVIALRPLPTEPAVELFVRRATAANATWRAEQVGHERVAALVAGLDQLPLTIEMAAARLASMSFAELEAALADGGPLLQLSHRSATRRHRSLESVVEWSAQLLEPDQRAVFTELAVFAGRVTADDVVAVVGGGAATRFALSALAERSLLDTDLSTPVSTYRMLETVRPVAEGWLAAGAGGSRAARRRHAAHFTARAVAIDRELRGQGEATAREQLAALAPELRVAHRRLSEESAVGDSDARRLADDLSRSLHLAAYTSFWGEPVEWSRRLQGIPGVEQRCGAQLVLAGAAANRGDLDVARRMAEELVDLDDPQVRGAALEVLCDVDIYSGRLHLLPQHAEQLEQLGRELDDAHWRSIALVDAALGLVFGGAPAKGARMLLAGSGVARSPSDQAWLAYARGEALAFGGSPGAADEFASAIELGGIGGNPFVVAVARLSLATEHFRAGRLDLALDGLDRCLRDHLRHGNFVHAVITLRSLVAVLVRAGDNAAAAIVGGASTRPDLRPSYGDEGDHLLPLLAGLEERLGDRYEALVAEGRALDVEQAVTRSLAFAAAVRGRTH